MVILPAAICVFYLVGLCKSIAFAKKELEYEQSKKRRSH
jgi:hypothetical protein